MSLEALFGLSMAWLVAVAVIAFAIAGFFLWVGARLAGVPQPGFGACMGASFLGTVAFFLLAWIPVLGWLVALVLYLIVIKSMLDTDFGRAVIAWLISVVAEAGAVVLIVGMIGSSIAGSV